MAGQAHEAITDAFNDFNITKVAKASLAIRFMSMLGSQNNPYAKFRNDYNTHHSIREEAQESFKEIFRVCCACRKKIILKLVELKIPL